MGKVILIACENFQPTQNKTHLPLDAGRGLERKGNASLEPKVPLEETLKTHEVCFLYLFFYSTWKAESFISINGKQIDILLLALELCALPGRKTGL